MSYGRNSELVYETAKRLGIDLPTFHVFKRVIFVLFISSRSQVDQPYLNPACALGQLSLTLLHLLLQLWAGRAGQFELHLQLALLRLPQLRFSDQELG